MESSPGFVPQEVGIKDCTDKQTFGQKSLLYDYIVKGVTSDEEYPAGACPPWVHGNFQVDNIKVNQNINATGTITAAEVTAGGITLTSRKSFDIPHPTKKGFRLRHVCLEGPESAVYIRGRLKKSNVIELPSYWKSFVDPESITVSLTQIGYSQDLIVQTIEWGSRIIIKSGMGTEIDCYYVIYGERMDGEKLIVEYEGESVSDYPGNNDEYSVSGFHYDTRNPLDKPPQVP